MRTIYLFAFFWLKFFYGHRNISTGAVCLHHRLPLYLATHEHWVRLDIGNPAKAFFWNGYYHWLLYTPLLFSGFLKEKYNWMRWVIKETLSFQRKKAGNCFAEKSWMVVSFYSIFQQRFEISRVFLGLKSGCLIWWKRAFIQCFKSPDMVRQFVNFLRDYFCFTNSFSWMV